MTTTPHAAHPRETRPKDPADISSTAFWSKTAAERETTFAELRAERPVSWHAPIEGLMFEDPNDQGFWAVTRHADLIEATKRHEDFLSGEGILMESMPQELLDTAQGFIAMDPPRHTKIRRLLTSAFTPRQLDRINGQIDANAAAVVDGIAAKGSVDFVAEVAALVPMHNICDMMGVPQEVRAKVAHEAQFAGSWNDPELLDGAEPLPRLFEASGYIFEVASDLIAQRRRKPEADLMTNLVQAEVDGEQLTDEEIISFFGLLTVAGNDTTRQSLSHTMKALTDFPDQREWLMADFDGRIKPAVEEMVRWATPIMTFRRTAARDCELNGAQITAGDKVVLFYASANWDTEVFDHPERLNLGRNPNPHIAFGGGGIHHCLGGQLARRQITATWRELLHRLPDIAVSGEPSYTVSNFFHGVNHLPVTFTPERRPA
ncbi:cytochrome P450 [Rhodococcus sp. X156]|uniref:cytochrome P450 n=1 Tax=Rhodococcus sp. X156 TaxID=2499145 RepID=UPI000FDC1CDD|nr:cytochrome P450 [Rhodococcus sp. X156]